MQHSLIAGLLLAVAATAMAADNTLGTWKYDAAKSVPPRDRSPYSDVTMVRTAIPGGTDVTVRGTRADGSRVDAHYTVRYDGKAVAVAGGGLGYDSSP